VSRLAPVTDWTGVRERVVALRGVDPQLVFGALGHGFGLEEPLSPGELADLEAQLGVDLPADYRSFLLEVAAGGAGPCYGVFSVRRGEGGWSWSGDGAELTDLELLPRPFPGPIGSDALSAFYDTEPDEDDFEDEDEYAAALAEFDRREEQVVWSSARTAGALCLCHLGCALRQWLVVAGPQRGTMWNDGRADGGDLTRIVAADGEPVTFGRWYLGWLSGAEELASSRR
jgi:SMI1 / KNR4 family (SUKH-1)